MQRGAHIFFSYLLKCLVITSVSLIKTNGDGSLMQYLYTVASNELTMASLLFIKCCNVHIETEGSTSLLLLLVGIMDFLVGKCRPTQLCFIILTGNSSIWLKHVSGFVSPVTLLCFVCVFSLYFFLSCF